MDEGGDRLVWCGPGSESDGEPDYGRNGDLSEYWRGEFRGGVYRGEGSDGTQWKKFQESTVPHRTRMTDRKMLPFRYRLEE